MRTHVSADSLRLPGGADSGPLPPLDPASFRRVLAVRADNIGDVVMAGPALRAIKAAAPQARLTLLASPGGAQAAPLLPWVDSVIAERVSWQALPPAPQVGPEGERRLVERLAGGGFDAAFLFTSFSQTPWPAAHACLMAGIPVRVGQAADFGGAVLTHRVQPAPDGAHQVDRNLRLVAGIGIPARDRSLAVVLPIAARLEARALLAAAGVGEGQPYIVLAPGASAAARRYPADRFAAVAAGVHRRLPGRTVVLVGSAEELPRLTPVIAVDGVRSLAGRTSVPALAAVLAGASLVITSHSAPMHLADALGVPVVALFSGTDRRSEWAPRRAPSAVLGHEPSCAPCRTFDCPFGLECLEIDPAEVVEAAARLARPLPAGPPIRAQEMAWTASAS